MKILNTLQDLWQYSLFCPICQEMSRNVTVTVGPDFVFELESFAKIDNNLQLICTFKRSRKIKYKVEYNINTLTNQFEVQVTDIPTDDNEDTTEMAKAGRAYFYFYVHGDCPKCNASHCNSSDIELNMTKKLITNIGIERAGTYLLNHKDKYHITTAYDSDIMMISKCSTNDAGELLEDDKIFECPIVNFDFSKPERVIEKIKTLMIFS